MSTNAGPNSRAGKPINVGDACTLVGTILTVAQTMPESQAVVTVQLASSGNVVSAQAFDVAASTQTL